ncbi:MAG: hypothetical protein JW862_03735 [Anaerolineales bacterium]|nr:hypothetical protein [Anaerolineales bacterium]
MMDNTSSKSASKQTIYRRAGLLLFSLGILLGILLFGSAVWADLEAFLFDSALKARTSLTTLSCPVMISSKETGMISANIRNPNDRETKRIVRVHITEGYTSLIREINTDLLIEANSSSKVEWEIYPDDAVYNDRLIMFRAYLFPNYPIPDADGSCGVLLVQSDTFTGRQILIFTITVSLVLIGAGRWLWQLGVRPISQTRIRNIASSMNWLGGIVIAGIVLSLLEYWGPSGLALIVSLLLIGVIFGRYVPSDT